MPEVEEAPAFWIREGVRRAKAFELAGFTELECEIYRSDSTMIATARIPLRQLWSPKQFIDVSSPRLRERFEKIQRAVAAGHRIDPIAVEQGSRGYPLVDVTLNEEGDL